MKAVTTILFILLIVAANGQKIGKQYIGLSSDSTKACNIKFLDDSTIQLSTRPRHMSGSLNLRLNYTISTKGIQIVTQKASKNDSAILSNWKIDYFLNPEAILTFKSSELIDETNSIIYVTQKEYNKNHHITWVVNNKVYYQKEGYSNGYGLVAKTPKQNRRLQRALKEIKQNQDNYSFKILRGLQAYKIYGAKVAQGLIIVTPKT